MNALILLALSLLLPAGDPRARIGDLTGRERRMRGTPPAMLLFIVIVGLVGLIFLLLGQLSVAVAGGIALATAATTIRAFRATSGARRRAAATGVFLGHLLGELRAGAGMPQAMAAAADATAGEAPAEFNELIRVTAARTLAGGSGPSVLLDAEEKIPDLAETAQLWRIAEHHGIPMAPLIGQARDRLDARARHRAATAASLQGPQATAVVLTLLPVAGVLMGVTMGADPLGLLFGGGLGGILLVVGVGLSCAGFIWSRRIIIGAQG